MDSRKVMLSVTLIAPLRFEIAHGFDPPAIARYLHIVRGKERLACAPLRTGSTGPRAILTVNQGNPRTDAWW